MKMSVMANGTLSRSYNISVTDYQTGDLSTHKGQLDEHKYAKKKKKSLQKLRGPFKNQSVSFGEVTDVIKLNNEAI